MSCTPGASAKHAYLGFHAARERCTPLTVLAVRLQANKRFTNTHGTLVYHVPGMYNTYNRTVIHSGERAGGVFASSRLNAKEGREQHPHKNDRVLNQKQRDSTKKHQN